MTTIWFVKVARQVEAGNGQKARGARHLLAAGRWLVPPDERPAGWQKLKPPDSAVESQSRENDPTEVPPLTGATDELLLRRTA